MNNKSKYVLKGLAIIVLIIINGCEKFECETEQDLIQGTWELELREEIIWINEIDFNAEETTNLADCSRDDFRVFENGNYYIQPNVLCTSIGSWTMEDWNNYRLTYKILNFDRTIKKLIKKDKDKSWEDAKERYENLGITCVVELTDLQTENIFYWFIKELNESNMEIFYSTGERRDLFRKVE